MNALKPAKIATLLAIVLIPSFCSAQETKDVPMRHALTRELVDVANCRVLRNGKAAELDVPRMLFALGVTTTVDAPYRLWTAGSVTGELQTADTFQYVVAFKQPIAIGAVLG